ncbi:MAG: transposase [Methanobrevibacter sp.]|jgi:putative transposase|nr:transposase [Candidatus Methanovirga procula]
MVKQINESYKYRIYPTTEQVNHFFNHFGIARFVFNQIKTLYESDLKSLKDSGVFKPKYYLNKKTISHYYRTIKAAHKFLKEMDSRVIIAAGDNLIRAYQNISKLNNGWVKYKSRKSNKSFRTIRQGQNIKLIGGKLKIPKLNSLIKMKYHQKIKGRILSATVSYENNRYFVSINVDKSPVIPKKKTGRTVGIDLGLNSSITTSLPIGEDGFKSGKLEHKLQDKRIDKFEKILSRKRRCSGKWYKVKAKLNTVYRKKKNYIEDKINYFTTRIVCEFDHIYVGDVNSQLGLKNKCLAKTTADSHWFEIKRQLEYKADWYGKEFEIVNE